MMFRKLYWVTEQVENSGLSRVTGVYTSIPDLINHGLKRTNQGSFRLTLTKLDSDKDPLGTWTSPKYDGLERKLEEFVLTDEFSKEQCVSLMEALTSKERVAA